MALNSPRLSIAFIALLSACAPGNGNDATPYDGDRKRAPVDLSEALPPDPDLNPFLGIERFNQWRRTHAEACLTIGETPSNDTERGLAAIRDAIEATDLGGKTLAEMRGTRVSICHESTGVLEEENRVEKIAGVFWSARRALGVTSDVTEGRQILTSAHEYRHAWQNHNMGFAFDDKLGRVAHATRTLMIEADARTFAVGVAWQLKQAGDSRAWDAAMSLRGTYRPIAQAFQARMRDIARDEGRAAVNNDDSMTRAMTDAYNAWFTAPENSRQYINRLNRLFVERIDDWRGTEDLPRQFGVWLSRLPGVGEGRPSYLGQGALAQAQIEAIRKVQFPEGTRLPITPMASSSGGGKPPALMP
ncbi:MAG: DUF6782 family putative metallopeptidase [Pseudomonadota bacterium]